MNKENEIQHETIPTPQNTEDEVWEEAYQYLRTCGMRQNTALAIRLLSEKYTITRKS